MYAGKLKAKISTIPPLSCKSRKREIAGKRFMDLQPAFLNGDGFTLSEIRDAINEKIQPEEIQNKEVKGLLMEHFCDSIKLCPSSRKKESLLLFSSSLTPDAMAAKIRSIDIIKDAALILRDELMKKCLILMTNFVMRRT